MQSSQTLTFQGHVPSKAAQYALVFLWGLSKKNILSSHWLTNKRKREQFCCVSNNEHHVLRNPLYQIRNTPLKIQNGHGLRRKNHSFRETHTSFFIIFSACLMRYCHYWIKQLCYYSHQGLLHGLSPLLMQTNGLTNKPKYSQHGSNEHRTSITRPPSTAAASPWPHSSNILPTNRPTWW